MRMQLGMVAGAFIIHKRKQNHHHHHEVAAKEAGGVEYGPGGQNHPRTLGESIKFATYPAT